MIIYKSRLSNLPTVIVFGSTPLCPLVLVLWNWVHVSLFSLLWPKPFWKGGSYFDSWSEGLWWVKRVMAVGLWGHITSIVRWQRDRQRHREWTVFSTQSFSPFLLSFHDASEVAQGLEWDGLMQILTNCSVWKKITVVKEEDWNTLPEYQVRDSLTTATGRGIGVPESVCR